MSEETKSGPHTLAVDGLISGNAIIQWNIYPTGWKQTSGFKYVSNELRDEMIRILTVK